MAMDVGWILKGLEKAGKTRAGIARALGGIHPSQVTRLLKGDRRLLAEEVTKIASYLGENPPGSALPRVDMSDGLPSAQEIADARKAQEIMARIAGIPADDLTLAACLAVVRSLRAGQ